MRIKFLKEVDADIDQLPPSAWGGLLLRVKVTVPDFAAQEGEEVQAVVEPETGPLRHYYPIGAIAEVPNDFGADCIADGSAELHISPRGQVFFGVERPEADE